MLQEVIYKRTENLGVPKYYFSVPNFENNFSVPVVLFSVPNSCASVPKLALEVPIISASVPVLAYEKVPFGGEYDREWYREGLYQKNKTIQTLEWIESSREHYMLGSSSCGIGARGVGRTLRGRPALRLCAN